MAAFNTDGGDQEGDEEPGKDSGGKDCGWEGKGIGMKEEVIQC